MFKRHRKTGLVVLAAAAASAFAFASSASAVSYTNACRNNVQVANWDQIAVTMTANAPASVGPGGSVPLTAITQDVAVPPQIFLAGYSLGLLSAGPNSIPATLHSLIDAGNTVQGSQSTNNVDTALSTTISDPNGTPGTGDETATPGSATVTFADETWTAGASGTIGFHEPNDTAITGVAGGGIIAVAHIGGAINVQFHCTSGTVAGSSPGVPTFSDAPSFASTQITNCKKLRKKLKKAKKAHNKAKVKKIRGQLRKSGC